MTEPDSEPTKALLKHRHVEAGRQTRTIVTIVFAGAIADICYWFYRESGRTGFFAPMLILHTVCVSIGILILHKHKT